MFPNNISFSRLKFSPLNASASTGKGLLPLPWKPARVNIAACSAACLHSSLISLLLHTQPIFISQRGNIGFSTWFPWVRNPQLLKVCMHTHLHVCRPNVVWVNDRLSIKALSIGEAKISINYLHLLSRCLPHLYLLIIIMGKNPCK